MKITRKVLGSMFLLAVVFAAISAFDFVLAQSAEPAKDIYVTRWAFITAAVATGLSALAGGIAVAYVGAAAVGAVSEKPEVAGRTLIFVGLAEGIAIYGLITAIMILGKV
jgi:V/A-type H+-transporting ATPase subunit K